MSSVTLTCNVASNNGSLFTVQSYQWNAAGCYTNSKFTGSTPDCFIYNQKTQRSVTGNNLNAEDAGTITCTVTISGSDYTSEPFTLRISGEQLVYCVIACIVYCKQCMQLLLATCYCCIIHQLVWFMYRGVFTVGVAITSGSLIPDHILTDYSHVNARSGNGNGNFVARCLTGLGPTGTNSDANNVLGGWYFNGTMIPNSDEQASCSSDVIQARAGATTAGVINLHQCQQFSTAAEGVYTCTMMNSSMMNESFRFGAYFTGRSKSLKLDISHHLTIFHLSTQLLQ